MTERIDLVVFQLGSQRYALPLAAVERVVRAVEVTVLPGAPPAVVGLIDVQGQIVPVFDLRRRFRSAEREITPEDQFLIARTATRAVALVVEACGVIARERSAVVGSDPLIPGHEHFPAVVKLDEGLALIHDLEKFLSDDEARTLDEAMSRAT